MTHSMIVAHDCRAPPSLDYWNLAQQQQYAQAKRTANQRFFTVSGPLPASTVAQIDTLPLT